MFFEISQTLCHLVHCFAFSLLFCPPPLPSLAITVKFPKKTTPKLVLINSRYIEAGTSCCFHLVFNFHNLLKACKLCGVFVVFFGSTLQQHLHFEIIKFWTNSIPLSCRGQHFLSSSTAALMGPFGSICEMQPTPRGCNSSFSKKKSRVPPQSLPPCLAFLYCFSSSLFVEGPQPATTQFLHTRNEEPPSLPVAPFVFLAH